MTPKVVYPCLMLFVLVWWYLAFNTTDSFQEKPNEILPDSSLKYPIALSPINREVLHKALAGDTALMVSLIATWDIDAQLLNRSGSPAKRLPEEEFFLSQSLGRLNKKELEQLNASIRLPWIQDDTGQLHSLKKKHQTVFPQTYMSANFLLALLETSQILAIPKGLREQKSLYNEEFLKDIPFDIDTYHTELLYQNPPDIAFVAHYSNPNTLQALKDQGIALATFKHMETQEDVYNALDRTGHLVNHPMQARLLGIFIRAALLNMNNRLAAYANAPQKILYARYDGRFSIPKKTTLPGELLQPLGINHFLTESLEKASETQWSAPITLEELCELNPELLIISAQPGITPKEILYQHPPLKSLRCFKDRQVYFVDQNIQDSTSQYLALAYYDLFQILANFRAAR